MEVEEQWDELDQLVFRRSKVPTVDQQENYLELLVEGVPHVAAAKKVGSTGTAMKAHRRRAPHFARLCEQAEAQAPAEMQNRVRATLWEIIGDPKHPRHWEAVKFAAEIYLQETEYKRERKIKQRIEMESALAATLQISVEMLQTMPEEQLDGLISTMQELQVAPRLHAVE